MFDIQKYLNPSNWVLTQSEEDNAFILNKRIEKYGLSSLSAEEKKRLDYLGLKKTREFVFNDPFSCENEDFIDVISSKESGLPFDLEVKTFQIQPDVTIGIILKDTKYPVTITNLKGLDQVPSPDKESVQRFISKEFQPLVDFWFGMIWSNKFFNEIIRNSRFSVTQSSTV